MENQYCILPISILQYVEFDIASVKTYIYFKVIDIIGDKDPYLAFFDIFWDFESYPVIDLKWETMNFEVHGMHVIQPLIHIKVIGLLISWMMLNPLA